MLRIHKLDKETGKPTADSEAIDRWAANCLAGWESWLSGGDGPCLVWGMQGLALAT